MTTLPDEECPSTDRQGARHPPLAVEMILHFYTSADPFARLAAPACLQTLNWMLHEGMIEAADAGYGATYRPTSRGEAWVWMICNTPLPELEWVDRRKGASRPTLWIESAKRSARFKAQKGQTDA